MVILDVIIFLIVLGMIGLCIVGVRAVAARADANGNYRRKFMEAQGLIDELQSMAPEHVVLGDSFAAITLDKIRDYNKEISK